MNAIFEDGSVFQATICDQILSRNRNDELQIIFTVQITAKATTDLGSGVGMEPFERDVFVTLSEDGQKLNIARENLKRLGVEGVDIIKFHPDHPEFDLPPVTVPVVKLLFAAPLGQPLHFVEA